MSSNELQCPDIGLHMSVLLSSCFVATIVVGACGGSFGCFEGHLMSVSQAAVNLGHLVSPVGV